MQYECGCCACTQIDCLPVAPRLSKSSESWFCGAAGGDCGGGPGFQAGPRAHQAPGRPQALHRAPHVGTPCMPCLLLHSDAVPLGNCTALPRWSWLGCCSRSKQQVGDVLPGGSCKPHHSTAWHLLLRGLNIYARVQPCLTLLFGVTCQVGPGEAAPQRVDSPDDAHDHAARHQGPNPNP